MNQTMDIPTVGKAAATTTAPGNTAEPLPTVSPPSTSAGGFNSGTSSSHVTPEDDQGGLQVDTFSNYKPSALPPSIIELCNGDTTSDLGGSIETPIQIDDSNQLFDDVSSSPPLQTLQLTVPSHTSVACESALLSSVSAPLVECQAAETLLPLLRKNKTALSPLQLEGVLLAIQRHRRIENVTPNDSNSNGLASAATTNSGGYRAGFFLGDGAGIGKGRQISAVIRDSFMRGRKRHLWFSVSRELIQDAKRDLRAVEVLCPQIHDGTQLLSEKHAGLGRSDRGVMFLTYQLLVSSSRVESIISWCAGTEILRKSKTSAAKVLELERSWDGCIVFDEAHKAKNLADNTKTAKLVLELQRRLPRARVLYCSATGVSDVAQLAYAERLGLWGSQNQTPAEANLASFATFNIFQSSLEKRGLGSMELLALELKTRGSFMARTLSWDGAEFKTEVVALTRHQQRIYNKAVEWWIKCKKSMEKAFKLLNLDGSTAGSVWRTFWAAHQRFFKELAIAFKIPYLANDASRSLDEGHAVVVGLQSTGETALQSLLSSDSCGKHSKLSETAEFSSLISTVRMTMTGFVEKHFPTTPAAPKPPSLPNRRPTSNEELHVFQLIQEEINKIKNQPPPEPLAELVKAAESLVESADRLELPPNPLDDLIDRLGGEGNVAEMTGRAGRIVKVGQNVYRYKKRSSEKTALAAVSQDEASDRVNLAERRSFMDGRKSVAIISDAASTGISLHAAKGSAASHKRRVHYTIELPWSADRCVQQLGRSHRSGQESSPMYKLVVTNLGGERRFAAAVSKRLASLGALTKGDRRAATGSDMSSFDLDSKYGKRALKRFYKSMEVSQQIPSDSATEALPSRKSHDIINEFVKSADGSCYVNESGKANIASVLSLILVELECVGIDTSARNKSDVRIFLNRLAGIGVAKQSLVFSLFMSTLDDVINEAKSSGEFEETAEDLKATTIEIGDETDLIVDPSCGVATKLTNLVIDRGVSFSQACTMALKEAEKEDEASAAISKKDPVQEQKELINDDEEDDENDDTWLSNSQQKEQRYRAYAGFYVSKNKIAGRRFVLFAKGKFDLSLFNSSEEAEAFDPMGLCVITRPNTGTSHTDMTSSQLLRKYTLVVSCTSLMKRLNFDTKPKAVDLADLMQQKEPAVANLWESAFNDSNSFDTRLGLAPRRLKVCVVTGPVLHILPVLEKAVQFKSERDRAMRIIRASVGHRQIVGPRFPPDEESRLKLQEELAKATASRPACTFVDEGYAAVCESSSKWLTTERPTMKSFFSSVPSSRTAKESSDESPTANARIGSTSSAAKRSTSATVFSQESCKKKMKTASMMSFFSLKKK